MPVPDLGRPRPAHQGEMRAFKLTAHLGSCAEVTDLMVSRGRDPIWLFEDGRDEPGYRSA
jgi:hypothetical protein